MASKYRAFISYSHRDDAWAAWLHKSLEAYKPPKQIVGQAGKNGTIPERLAPVFRDREELPTATDLGSVIDEALRGSETLLVLCSPASARSQWVNEEVLAFKRLGREDRIFCLIIGGEPNGSDKPELGLEECFPNALRYKLGPDGQLSDERTEPIAADARDGKDGKTNAKLKLIAGMLGVGFDVLKQREQQRRQRRMAMVASAATVGMVITTTLAAAAFIARAEADRQRVRAESEAETARQTANFMVDLFKVSDPSEARGNTITAREILDRGAQRIETELQGEPTIQGTLMDTVGTVYMALGLYDQAEPLLEGALARRQQRLGLEHPDSALTQAHLGELQRLRADYTDAERDYRQALEVQRRELGDKDPAVADSLAGLADVLSALGRFDEAEAALREALEIRVQAHGKENADVALTMEKIAVAQENQGNLAPATKLMEESLAMQRRLWGNRPHPDLAEALNELAFLLYQEGDYTRTESLLRESLAMKQKLLGDKHPEIAVAYNNLAMVLHDKGDLKDAEAMYRKSLEMHREIEGDTHPEYARTLSNLAYVLYDEGNVRGALDAARKVLDIYQKNFPEGHPDYAATYAGIGGWLLELGELDEAESMMMKGLEMRRAVLGNDHPDVANSLVQLGMLDIATQRYQPALDSAREAEHIYAASLPEDHWRRAMARAIEGAALTGVGKLAEAGPLVTESYEIISHDNGALSVYVRAARRYVEQFFLTSDKPDEAAKYADVAEVSQQR